MNYRRPCQAVLCPYSALEGSPYCVWHQRLKPAQPERPRWGGENPLAQFYEDPAWRTFSRKFLKAHPVCVLCGLPSQVTDHFLQSAWRMIAEAGRFILEPGLYRPLCRVCNTAEARTVEAQEDRRRWKPLAMERIGIG